MTQFYVSKNILSKFKPTKIIQISIILIFFSFAVKAQIVYQEIRPSQLVEKYDNCHIDINNDGIIDLDIVYDYFNGYLTESNKFFIQTREHSSVALENDSVAKLNNLDIISDDLEWSNELTNSLLVHQYDWIEEELTIYGNWVNVKDGFVPLRLTINGDLHYAWLRLHFSDNLTLFAVDYAYNATPNEAINAGDGYHNSISSILATDEYNFFNGKDIEIKFSTPLDSTVFNEYRFILAEADDESALDLESMNQVPSDRYLSLTNLQEEYVNSMSLEGLYLDKDGDSIKKFKDYRVHVLNVAASGINSENQLSNPSNIFLLQAFAADVHKPSFNMWDSLITLDDIIFNINDIGVNDFTKEFRAFIIPEEDIDIFTVENALLTNRDYSLNIPVALNDIDTSFSNTQLDINGNPVLEKNPYFIKILSVPDSVYAVEGKLSEESNRIVLNAPNFMQAGDTISSDIHVYNCDYAFSDYEYWTGSWPVQSSADQEVDINRDGVPDFYFFGFNWSHHGSAYYLELYPYRDNKVLLCNHEEHENWIDVLDQDQLFGDNYRWSNDYALLKWYDSSGNGNSTNLGHYFGDYQKEYYIAFKIEDGDTPQLAWVKLRGNEFIRYGFQEITSGIAYQNRLIHFKIYPNPATDYIHLELPEDFTSKYLQVELINSMGQFVESFDFKTAETNIPVEHLTSGLYLLVLKENGKRIDSRSIIIQ